MSFFSGAARAKSKNSNFHFLIRCKILHTKEPYWGQNSKGLGTLPSRTHQHQLEAVVTNTKSWFSPWSLGASHGCLHQPRDEQPIRLIHLGLQKRDKTAVEKHPALLNKHPALLSFATPRKESLPCQQGSGLCSRNTKHCIACTGLPENNVLYLPLFIIRKMAPEIPNAS